MTEHLHTMIIVITYNFILLKTSFLSYYFYFNTTSRNVGDGKG